MPTYREREREREKEKERENEREKKKEREREKEIKTEKQRERARERDIPKPTPPQRASTASTVPTHFCCWHMQAPRGQAMISHHVTMAVRASVQRPQPRQSP